MHALCVTKRSGQMRHICPCVCSEDSCLFDYSAFQESLLEGLRCSQGIAWSFPRLSLLDLLAGASEDNGRSANGSNQARIR